MPGGPLWDSSLPGVFSVWGFPLWRREGLLCMGCSLDLEITLPERAHSEVPICSGTPLPVVFSAWRSSLPGGLLLFGGFLCESLCAGDSSSGSPLWHLIPGSLSTDAFVSRALTRASPSLASEAPGGAAFRPPGLALGLHGRPLSAPGLEGPDPAPMIDRRRHRSPRTFAAGAGPRPPTSQGAACVGAAMTSCQRSPAPAP